MSNKIDLSDNPKIRAASLKRLPFDSNLLDTRGCRALAALLDHLLHPAFLSFQKGFHIACREITDPAGELEAVRDLLCPGAVTDPLNTTGDPEVGSNFFHTALLSYKVDLFNDVLYSLL